MLLRSADVGFAMWLLAPLAIAPVRAQDVPGIEICTVEKTMERRTSCLQSNVDFLQKTIGDLQAAQAKTAEDLKKKQDAPPAKDATNKDAAK